MTADRYSWRRVWLLVLVGFLLLLGLATCAVLMNPGTDPPPAAPASRR